MVLNLWNYLKGYVIIEVTGFSVERFMNLAAHKGIYVWDVEMGSGHVRMKVSIKGFKELKPCARKTKCKCRIIQKAGYPFAAYKYRKRRLFLVGGLLFVTLLFFMSSFVWLVEIEGCVRLQEEELLAFCREAGLKPGAYKPSVDRKELERQMALHFSDISFINIGIQGTRVTVTISETLPGKAIEDVSIPGNIVAKKDGLILSIVASRGTPVVKAKDVVQKGDVLISGEIVVNPGTEAPLKDYVRAGGQVLAKLFYEITFQISDTYIEKRYTGQSKTYYSFNILNNYINILNPSNLYSNYDKITENNQINMGGGFYLPISVIKDIYREYEPVEHKRNLEQMLEIAEIIVNDKVTRDYQPGAEVVDKTMDYTQEADGIKVRALITTIENIGEEAPFDFIPQN